MNGEVLGRAGISQSLIPRTLYAIQILDLIDESGVPTPTFEGLRVAPETEFRKRLEDWVKAAYADVFAFVDPTKDDETRIRDAFRNYHPVGQQARMVTLFQGLCTLAGLMPEKISAPRAESPVRYRAYVPRNVAVAAVARAAKLAKPAASYASPGLPPALAGLLTNLPSPEVGWTKDTRDKFMDTFGAVLDFVVPIVKHVPAKENGGPERPPFLD